MLRKNSARSMKRNSSLMKKPRLYILRGLPASGKSYKAKQLVAGGAKRINFDDMRSMLDDGKWSTFNEDILHVMANRMAEAAFTAGCDVVLDNTNLSKNQLKLVDSISAIGFEAEWIDLTNVPLNTCLERDAGRGDKSVGRKVIIDMWNKYIRRQDSVQYNPALPECIISDMDGTLSDFTGVRGPFEYDKCDQDNPRHHVIEAVRGMAKGRYLIVVSGREDICKPKTYGWLKYYAAFDPYRIHMRKTGDHRKDTEVKREIYEKYIKGQFNVMAVFDDRASVCEMWDELGLGDVLFRVGKVNADNF